jgi:hypothetical protein
LSNATHTPLLGRKEDRRQYGVRIFSKEWNEEAKCYYNALQHKTYRAVDDDFETGKGEAFFFLKHTHTHPADRYFSDVMKQIVSNVAMRIKILKTEFDVIVEEVSLFMCTCATIMYVL